MERRNREEQTCTYARASAPRAARPSAWPSSPLAAPLTMFPVSRTTASTISPAWVGCMPALKTVSLITRWRVCSLNARPLALNCPLTPSSFQVGITAVSFLLYSFSSLLTSAGLLSLLHPVSCGKKRSAQDAFWSNFRLETATQVCSGEAIPDPGPEYHEWGRASFQYCAEHGAVRASLSSRRARTDCKVRRYRFSYNPGMSDVTSTRSWKST